VDLFSKISLITIKDGVIRFTYPNLTEIWWFFIFYH